MESASFKSTNIFNVLIGDVHRVDEIIPGLFYGGEQLIDVFELLILLLRGQGVLNFLKLLI